MKAFVGLAICLALCGSVEAQSRPDFSGTWEPVGSVATVTLNGDALTMVRVSTRKH
jgi:hypothetical protein